MPPKKGQEQKNKRKALLPRTNGSGAERGKARAKKPADKASHVTVAKRLLAEPSKAAAVAEAQGYKPIPWLPDPTNPLAKFDTGNPDHSAAIEWYWSVADFTGKKRAPTKLETICKTTPELLKRYAYAIHLGATAPAAFQSCLGLSAGYYLHVMNIGRAALEAGESSPYGAFYKLTKVAEAYARASAEIAVKNKTPREWLSVACKTDTEQALDASGKPQWIKTDGSYTSDPSEAAAMEDGSPLPAVSQIVGWEAAPPKQEVTVNTIAAAQAHALNSLDMGGMLDLQPQEARQALEHLMDLGLVALTGQSEQVVTRLTKAGGNGEATKRANKVLTELFPSPPSSSSANGNSTLDPYPQAEVEPEGEEIDFGDTDDEEQQKRKDHDKDIWQ